MLLFFPFIFISWRLITLHLCYFLFFFFFYAFGISLTSLQATAIAKSLQLCPTLCDPIDVSSPGSPVPGILQARTLEWVAISFSNAWKWKVKGKLLSRVRLLATSWIADYQAPPSTGFSRQEYWSGVPLPFPSLQAKPCLKTKLTVTKVNKWDLTRLKTFCTSKETTNKTKRQPTEQKKIFANKATDTGLFSKIYK